MGIWNFHTWSFIPPLRAYQLIKFHIASLGADTFWNFLNTNYMPESDITSLQMMLEERLSHQRQYQAKDTITAFCQFPIIRCVLVECRSWLPFLSSYWCSNKRKPELEINVGHYVACVYDNDWWIGLILYKISNSYQCLALFFLVIQSWYLKKIEKSISTKGCKMTLGILLVEELNFMCTKFQIPTSVWHCSSWLFKVGI